MELGESASNWLWIIGSSFAVLLLLVVINSFLSIVIIKTTS